MDLVIAQILSIAKSMWKYRWPAVLVAWIAGAIGAGVVFMMPDRYEASARIYVDTQSILKPLMSGLAVQPNVEQQVSMLSRTLISRPNVEKLIRMADLDLKSQSKSSQEATIDEVTKSLSIQSTARDNLYTLSFRDTDPESAKRVVQSLVTIFIESGLGASRKDTATAATFINEQIKTYEAKLEDAETRLKEFRLKNIDIMKGEGQDSAARVSAISTELQAARLSLREAENARDAAQRQVDAERSRFAAGNSAQSDKDSALSVPTPEIDTRLDQQRRNLDGLLQRFTDEHPDVISARKLIKDLEDQKRKEVQELRRAAASGTAPAGGNSLVQQELMRMLASSEVQAAAMRARVAEYSSRYDKAVSALKTAPQLESEAAQLNRDYAIHKKNYEDLVSRRESAAMSGDLDVASGVADFRLIDPPRATPKPVAPNRLMLMAGVLVMSIGAGLFVAFAASQLRPVFHDAHELRTRAELPVLGVVSRLVTDADRRRQRIDLLRFGAASGGLVGVFAIGLVAMAFMLSRQVS